MDASIVGLWIGIAGLLVTVGALLVRLGRVLERQDVHDRQMQKHDDRLDDLEAGHGEHVAAFERLGGEISGLKGVMEMVHNTLREWITRVDRHMEGGRGT